MLVASALLAQPSRAENVTPTTNSAAAWLSKLGHSLRSLNYRIAFVVTQSSGHSLPYLWRHGVVDGVEMEHLSILNGPGREVFRIADKLSYFEPSVLPFSIRSSNINGPIPQQLFQSPQALTVGYHLLLAGKGRVAGLPAQQVRIVSKHQDRYSFNLWLERNSGLLLKMDMRNAEGKLLEQIQVTSLLITPAPDPYFAKIERAKLPPISPLPLRPSRPATWAFSSLPAGMQMVRRDARILAATGEPVEYALLSDGMVDVSVYLSKASTATIDTGWLQYEALTLLAVNKGVEAVTVVGKIPLETAKGIAAAIHSKRTTAGFRQPSNNSSDDTPL